MKIIPTLVHGILDYPVGLALLAAPQLFGFADSDGPQVLIPRLLGAVILLQSVMTRYELGMIKLLPMKAHLMNDYIGGALLAVSPWLFGFASQAPNRWVPHLAFGLFILMTTAMTRTQPREAVAR
ncbi:MAG TPA: SPW repeat protein [Prosthecobacter sp.]|nr:SPW repeat protein [Prosthecobacter sp.]